MPRPQLDPHRRRARLWHRHHLGRTAPDVASACADVVAMHSSDPLTPHLGLWARVPGYETPDLDLALVDTRSVCRLHAMRRTLWIVPAAQVPMVDAAAAQAVAARERKRLLGWVHAERGTDPAAWLHGVEEQALDAVRASPGVTSRGLTAALPDLATQVTVGSGKWATRVSVGPRLLMVLAMEGKLVRTAPSGSWKSSQYGWAAGDSWWPQAMAPSTPIQARQDLVSRYLVRFGPVTETDVAWWTGFTKAQTRRALADADAVEVTLDTGTAWVAAEDLADDAPPTGVSLLPGLDPTPMGWKQRDWYLGDHRAALFDRNGNVGPTVWVDGRVVGGWAVRSGGRVVSRLLEDVGQAAATAVQAQVDALQAWLGGTEITPRFRTPLERELVG